MAKKAPREPAPEINIDNYVDARKFARRKPSVEKIVGKTVTDTQAKAFLINLTMLSIADPKERDIVLCSFGLLDGYVNILEVESRRDQYIRTTGYFGKTQPRYDSSPFDYSSDDLKKRRGTLTSHEKDLYLQMATCYLDSREDILAIATENYICKKTGKILIPSPSYSETCDTVILPAHNDQAAQHGNDTPPADNVETSGESLDKKSNLLRKFTKCLLGSKKRIVVTAIPVICMILAAFCIISVVNGIRTKSLINDNDTGFEQNMDANLVFKLANANHLYEVGLENWRRLEYNRAERDISAALSEISTHKPQSELDVARVNNSLGCLYLDMGKYKDAYDYLNSAYITFRNKLGSNSIEARAVRASLSRYYYYTGMPDEALAETQYILDNSDEKTEKAVVANTYHLRAMIFDAQGKYEQALALYRTVLEMYDDISLDGKLREQLADYANDSNLSQTEKDYYTNSIRWIILTYNNMATVLIHKGDNETAIKAANTGINMSLSNIDIRKRNITASKLYMNLAIAQGALGPARDALNNADLAIRIQRNLFDFKDVFPGLVEAKIVYGDLLLKHGRSSDAKDSYADALNLAKNAVGENHPYTAAAFAAFGNYCIENNDPQAAINHFEESIEIRKNILAENHPDTAKVYYDLALAQRAVGKDSDATEYLLRAKTICEKWGVESPLTDHIEAALAR